MFTNPLSCTPVCTFDKNVICAVHLYITKMADPVDLIYKSCEVYLTQDMITIVTCNIDYPKFSNEFWTSRWVFYFVVQYFEHMKILIFSGLTYRTCMTTHHKLEVSIYVTRCYRYVDASNLYNQYLYL